MTEFGWYEQIFGDEPHGTYRTGIYTSKRTGKTVGIVAKHPCLWCGRSLKDSVSQYHDKCIVAQKNIAKSYVQT